MSSFQAPRPGILPAQSIETLIAAGAVLFFAYPKAYAAGFSGF